jgi:hypothetical protein
MELSGLRNWASNNVVPALTLAGIALYVVLRLPYSAYYGTLGATPEDVGLGYVEMLARSAVGVAALVVVAGLSTVLVFLYRFGLLLLRLLGANRAVGYRAPRDFADLDDAAYAQDRAKRRDVLAMVYPDLPQAEIDDQIAWRDQIRALRRTVPRTPAVNARLAALKREASDHGDAVLWRSLARDAGRPARHAGRWILAGLLVLTVVGLPLAARATAKGVRNCHHARLGPSGLFAIRVDHATLWRLGDDGSARPVLRDVRLMYLGRNDNEIVVFDCDSRHTVHVPADGIVVDASS